MRDVVGNQHQGASLRELRGAQEQAPGQHADLGAARVVLPVGSGAAVGLDRKAILCIIYVIYV